MESESGIRDAKGQKGGVGLADRPIAPLPLEEDRPGRAGEDVRLSEELDVFAVEEQRLYRNCGAVGEDAERQDSGELAHHALHLLVLCEALREQVGGNGAAGEQERECVRARALLLV